MRGRSFGIHEGVGSFPCFMPPGLTYWLTIDLETGVVRVHVAMYRPDRSGD